MENDKEAEDKHRSDWIKASYETAGWDKSLLLTDEERMNVDIPCETKCNRSALKFDSLCWDCIAIYHEIAQLTKVFKAGYLPVELVHLEGLDEEETFNLHASTPYKLVIIPYHSVGAWYNG